MTQARLFASLFGQLAPAPGGAVFGSFGVRSLERTAVGTATLTLTEGIAGDEAAFTTYGSDNGLVQLEGTVDPTVFTLYRRDSAGALVDGDIGVVIHKVSPGADGLAQFTNSGP